jgi:SAM-dependent methyltransferase
MGEISVLFGASASQYANFRPHYPERLFAWLAQHSPANGCALDIGCGNGQASRPLRAHFTQVLACDRSPARLKASPPLDHLIQQLYDQTLRGYWPMARTCVNCGYRDIAAPFPRIPVEALALQQSWDFAHLVGYLSPWPALQLYIQKNDTDPLVELVPAMQRAWGDPQQSHNAKWPLHFLAG